MIAAAAFPEHLGALLAGGAIQGVTAQELAWQYLNLLGLQAPVLDRVGPHREPSPTPYGALAPIFFKDRP